MPKREKVPGGTAPKAASGACGIPAKYGSGFIGKWGAVRPQAGVGPTN